MVNIRTKGQSGEREICDMLNEIYKEVYEELGKPFPEKPIAQRRQNQSAVGGDDVDNTCHYAIEVKRHETLNINTWWAQCTKSAKESGKFPCLLYRQSRKKWRCVMYVNPLRWSSQEPVCWVMADMSIDDFKIVFKQHALEYIRENGKA